VHHGRDVARNATWGGKQACRGSGECFSSKKNVFRRCLRCCVKRDETLDGYGGATTPLLASTAALAFWPIIDIQQLHACPETARNRLTIPLAVPVRESNTSFIAPSTNAIIQVDSHLFLR
jgi:hypothetical protein